MNKFFILFYLFLFNISSAQNLIYNGSNEELFSCPFQRHFPINTYLKNIYNYKSSPDALNECKKYNSNTIPDQKVGIPYNFAGYQWARTGKGMCVLYYRFSYINDTNKLGEEIITYKIKSKLKPNKKYCLKFYQSLTNYCGFATDISEGVLSDEFTNSIIDSCKYFSIISNSGKGYIKDTSKWVAVSGTFIANGKEKYIHIGRFHKLSQSNIYNTNLNTNNSWYYIIMYYLDDVALWPCDTVPPVAEAGDNKVICKGDSVEIGGNNYPDWYYSWWHDSICTQNGPTEIQRDEHNGIIKVSPSKTTWYYVQATDFKYDKTIDSVLVTVTDCSPAIDDTTICIGDEIIIGNQTFTYNSYLWTPPDFLDNNLIAHPTASPSENITYFVIATDTNGIIHKDSVHISVKVCGLPPEIIIPNVITPNGDGINDVFRFKNEEYWHLQVQVFNRWGQLVFSGTDPERWDGIFEGEKVSDGVYFYHITAKAEGFDKVFEYHGTVTVLDN